MKTVLMKNVEFGVGTPKICLPIVGKSKEEIMEQALGIAQTSVDIVEWRMDWFEHVEDVQALKEVAKSLRDVFKDTPILATFRSKKEGGEKEVSNEKYIEINIEIAKSGFVDAIDVELFSGDHVVSTIVEQAHEVGVKVIMSNHDFDKTPSYDEIISRLRLMQEKQADIPKIAVMPNNTSDVLTLLQATNDMHTKYADRPIITMSMAGTGVISRLCGEVFGSCLTFGAYKKASAPGQMNVEELRMMLTTLHNSL